MHPFNSFQPLDTSLLEPPETALTTQPVGHQETTITTPPVEPQPVYEDVDAEMPLDNEELAAETPLLAQPTTPTEQECKVPADDQNPVRNIGEPSPGHKSVLTELEITLNGRFISVGRPSAKVNLATFKTIVMRHRVPPGEVKVIDRLPDDLLLEQLRPKDTWNKIWAGKDELFTPRYQDMIYVRDLTGYWAGRFLINEIPSKLIMPSHKYGYYDHLCKERDEDGRQQRATLDDRYFENLSVLREGVELWIRDDADGTCGFEPFLTTAREARKLENAAKSLAIDPSRITMTDMDANENILKQPVNQVLKLDSESPPEEMQFESDNADANYSALAIPVPNTTPTEEEAYYQRIVEHENMQEKARKRLDKLKADALKCEKILAKSPPKSRDEKAREDEEQTEHSMQIQLMVSQSYEDEPQPHPESIPYRGEFLKLKPDLNVCKRCGQKSHTVHKCTFENSKDILSQGNGLPSEYERFSWAKPEAGSIAAEGTYGLNLSCVYPYCRNKLDHSVAACPHLHQRCGTCRTRGHDDLSFALNRERNEATTQCPIKRAALVKEGFNMKGPSWRELQKEFEGHADQGVMTRFRYSQPFAGWFPIVSEKDARILKAVGYRCLQRISAEESVTFLMNVSKATRHFGLAFKPFSDDDWTLIYKRRDAKRSADRLENKKAKMGSTEQLTPVKPKVPRKIPVIDLTQSTPTFPNTHSAIPRGPVDFSKPPPQLAVGWKSTPKPNQQVQQRSAAQQLKRDSKRAENRKNRKAKRHAEAVQAMAHPDGQALSEIKSKAARPPQVAGNLQKTRLKATRTVPPSSGAIPKMTRLPTGEYVPKGLGLAKPNYRSAYTDAEYIKWCHEHDKHNQSEYLIPPKRRPKDPKTPEPKYNVRAASSYEELF